MKMPKIELGQIENWQLFQTVGQCFSTFSSLRNPFGRQKCLRNPDTKEKNVEGTPWVRITFNPSVTAQYLIASSALCLKVIVLYLLSDINPINKCYFIRNICGILSNIKARGTLEGCLRNPRVPRNPG